MAAESALQIYSALQVSQIMGTALAGERKVHFIGLLLLVPPCLAGQQNGVVALGRTVYHKGKDASGSAVELCRVKF